MGKNLAKKAKKALGLGNTETPAQNQHIKWAFTYNNYGLDELVAIEDILKILCKCYCFKKEIGVNKTPHLQGHLTLLKKTTLSGLKTHSMFNKFHWEIKKGSEIQNDLYICKTDTSVDEIIYQYGYIKN